MATRFQTQVTRRRARYQVNSFTPQRMQSIAEAVSDSVKERIAKALDVDDSPAAPLKEGYKRRKQRRGGSSLRDWRYTGRLIRSLRVLRVSAGRAVVGFTDHVTNMRAAINNRRWRQFGVSPRDRVALIAAARSEKTIQAVQVA